MKALLRHVLGILPVIGYPLRHGENFLPVTKKQFLESLRLSALCGSDQRGVRVFVYTGCTRRFHESDPPPPLRHKVKKLTSTPATAHIERTGIWSTDGGRAECDTSREWIGVSWLRSFLRPVFWSGVAVTLTLARCDFYSPGKCQPPLKGAMSVPEIAYDESTWKWLSVREIHRFMRTLARASTRKPVRVLTFRPSDWMS